MTPSLFTCTWLLLPYCVLVTLSTGELEFYQDGIPDTPEDVALTQLARYLEAQGHRLRPPQRTRLSPFLLKPARKKLARQLELELDRVPERDAAAAPAAAGAATVIDKLLADILGQQKLGPWNYRQRHNDPVNDIRSREREYGLPHYEFDTSRIRGGIEDPWIKLPPYLPYQKNDERPNSKSENLEHPGDLGSWKQLLYSGIDLGKGMKEEPMAEYPEGFRDRDRDKDQEGKLLLQHSLSATDAPKFTFDDSNLNGKHPFGFAAKPNDPRYYQDTPFSSGTNEMGDEPKVEYRENVLGSRVNGELVEDDDGGGDDDDDDDDGDSRKNGKAANTVQPEFTFEFDDSNLSEKHPFAVKPNDPRYYRDEPFSAAGAGNELDFGDTLKNNSKWAERAKEPTKVQNHVTSMYEEIANNVARQFRDRSMLALPEPERRTGYHPLIVPVNHDLNNDIYFIAIVAGCSAAAMFALVLISLTWCRLQRGAKAAADIEYPAYGVTGPNKDVSPSGDQRLAQSAQMYHFQHQKQQIIAMENRTSATRDPGSVSEAESDEENEEGDYTVYECPGLASTGEMEVKNPLFHDDPTPATPAQSNKEEDHI